MSRVWRSTSWRAVVLSLAFATGLVATRPRTTVDAQEGPDWRDGLPRQHRSRWLVHDTERPRPRSVHPGAVVGDPPADAIVLFDGTDLDAFAPAPESRRSWSLADGVLRAAGDATLRTRLAFGDCQVHLEWRHHGTAPAAAEGASDEDECGLFFGERASVCIHDSTRRPRPADLRTGAIHGQHAPLVDASRPPGEWQTFDVVHRAARVDGGRVTSPAQVTVLHNGVVVQHAAAVHGAVAWRARPGASEALQRSPLSLRGCVDSTPIEIRRLWVRELEAPPGE